MKSYPVTKEALSHLYQWRVIYCSERESDVYDKEIFLSKHHFKTRVKKENSESAGYELSVPEKDALIAVELITGEISGIIDVPKDRYYVFNEDLTRRREMKFNPYGLKRNHLRAKYYMMMGFLLIVLLALFRFMARYN